MTKAVHEVTIRMPNEMLGGKYANLVSLTINDDEVVMDFAFRVAQSDQAEGLSRIVMSKKTSKSFLSMFQNALLDLENGKFTQDSQHGEKN